MAATFFDMGAAYSLLRTGSLDTICNGLLEILSPVWLHGSNASYSGAHLLTGITVGAVVVPQGMAYALLANLPTQFGLYTSFMGVLIYWFFATSKDITIGVSSVLARKQGRMANEAQPVAVLSTVTGNVVTSSLAQLPQYKDSPQDIASALAIICGAIVCFLGLVRLGWIVDVISLPAITAFMTGSALNIAVGQIPSLLGIPSKVVNSRDSTYLVIIHVLQHLNACKLDAAMGLTALAMLYILRSLCSLGIRRLPQRKKLFFFLSTLRTVFVILLYTMISWLVNMNYRTRPKFTILGTVPRGFQYAHVPTVNKTIVSSFTSWIPVTVIVMLIEHIAISKSFGRVNNYTIDPSQEMVAIGVSNLLGPFLGAYPATGSFSRTAIKSKAGVRTPFAGVITALVVLLAIYALPPVFFYIPNATLSGVIIHAVGDLITPPNTLYQFWRVNPLEVIIWFAGMLVTIFTSIENGIYVTISISMAVFLFRAFKAQGRFLGKAKIHSVVGDHVLDQEGRNGDRSKTNRSNDPDNSVRNVFLPLSHADGSNPSVELERPYPGVFIYRFSEGYNYPNANHYLDYMVKTILQETRRTNPFSYPRPGDRPWNDPGPRRGHAETDASHLPTLKAVILDFSSVNNIDITSVQHLIDVRNQLDRYTSPQRVDWHFAHINNRWTKRALVSAGFGYPSPQDSGDPSRWKPIFSVAEIGGQDSAANAAAAAEEKKAADAAANQDVEAASAGSRSGSASGDRIEFHDHGANATAGSVGDGRPSGDSIEYAKRLAQSKAYAKGGAVGRVAVVHGLNRPLFHIDLTSALQSAIANAEWKEGDAVPEFELKEH